MLTLLDLKKKVYRFSPEPLLDLVLWSLCKQKAQHLQKPQTENFTNSQNHQNKKKRSQLHNILYIQEIAPCEASSLSDQARKAQHPYVALPCPTELIQSGSHDEQLHQQCRHHSEYVVQCAETEYIELTNTSKENFASTSSEVASGIFFKYLATKIETKLHYITWHCVISYPKINKERSRIHQNTSTIKG